MAEHFPGGYEIIKEEETVVGQTTKYQEDQDSQREEKSETLSVATSQTTGTVTTRDATEYRIHYRRR